MFMFHLFSRVPEFA